MTSHPPDDPAGAFAPVEQYDEAVRDECTELIRRAPEKLQAALEGLSETQLDTRYKQWTIRQIANHLADSHVHIYLRFKWALTEDVPTIKPFEENEWANLDDSLRGSLVPTLAMFAGVHAKWVQVLESMTPEQFARTFFHPQSGETVSLWSAFNYCAWHGRHHTAQIAWLRDRLHS